MDKIVPKNCLYCYSTWLQEQTTSVLKIIQFTKLILKIFYKSKNLNKCKQFRTSWTQTEFWYMKETEGVRGLLVDLGLVPRQEDVNLLGVLRVCNPDKFIYIVSEIQVEESAQSGGVDKVFFINWCLFIHFSPSTMIIFKPHNEMNNSL